MRKRILTVILSLFAVVILLFGVIGIDCRFFSVYIMETFYEREDGKALRFGLTLNGKNYYEVDDFFYYVKDKSDEARTYREHLERYRAPMHKGDAYTPYLVELGEVFDYSALPELPKHKDYIKITHDFYILKTDSPENPIVIFKRFDDLSGEVDSWAVYLREDFSVAMLPTPENAKIKEIRILYNGIEDVYVLNEQEKQRLLEALNKHSAEEIKNLFSQEFKIENSETKIELEIEYENSPFIQYVGYYSEYVNRFWWAGDDSVS